MFRRVLVPAALALAACSDQAPAGPDGGDGDAVLSAIIGKTAWTARTGAVLTGVAHPHPGGYTITGTSDGATPTTMTFTLHNIPGPGTYPLGVGDQSIGGTVTLSTADAAWGVDAAGGEGVIVITALDADRIAGTFTFFGTPVNGYSDGAREVTGGRFDLGLAEGANTAPLPRNAGSAMRLALDDGVVLNATWARATTIGASLSVQGEHRTGSASVVLSDAASTGTYALGALPPRHVNYRRTDGIHEWFYTTNAVGGRGDVAISAFDGQRITGTFTGVLKLNTRDSDPFPPATTLTIVDGSFSIGRP